MKKTLLVILHHGPCQIGPLGQGAGEPAGRHRLLGRVAQQRPRRIPLQASSQFCAAKIQVMYLKVCRACRSVVGFLRPHRDKIQARALMIII